MPSFSTVAILSLLKFRCSKHYVDHHKTETIALRDIYSYYKQNSALGALKI
jgi:hypothetical protein